MRLDYYFDQCHTLPGGQHFVCMAKAFCGPKPELKQFAVLHFNGSSWQEVVLPYHQYLKPKLVPINSNHFAVITHQVVTVYRIDS